MHASPHLVVLPEVEHSVGHVERESVGEIGRLVGGVFEQNADVLGLLLRAIPVLVVPETKPCGGGEKEKTSC